MTEPTSSGIVPASPPVWYEAERELAEEDEVDTSAEAAKLDLPPLVPGRLS